MGLEGDMELHEELREAVDSIQLDEGFSAKTSIPGISFRMFDELMKKVPEDSKKDASLVIGHSVDNAQLSIRDEKYNAETLGIEIASSLKRRGIEADQKACRLIASAILYPLWQHKISDPRVMKEYQKWVANRIQKLKPTTPKELDKVIYDSSEFLRKK